MNHWVTYRDIGDDNLSKLMRHQLWPFFDKELDHLAQAKARSIDLCDCTSRRDQLEHRLDEVLHYA